MPGVDKKDIALNFKDDVLTVDAKRDSFSDESDPKGNIITSERDYGTYSRSYRLPQVDGKAISAKYEDGVLTVTLPKPRKKLTRITTFKLTRWFENPLVRINLLIRRLDQNPVFLFFIHFC